ncbi:MAG TPA: type II secretion protein ATPase [Rhodospirillaceae bacterium]|jgi:pilus assembly protein CpaE|nr:type II secretion protein ATPase [Alphaproteobacteria bacterium]HBH26526.1 type II secretion protein ATPase [Rhodospirillaceae bacterium]
MSSSAPSHQTAVLLPTASVAIFSRHAETLEAARALTQDWRFARVTVEAHEGDTDTAIATYQRNSSPDMLMVQTDNIDEGFTDKLGELAGCCEEKTAAVVVGPVNDVALYRRLITMGVSDYLVHPVKVETLAEVIARALLERLGVMDSRLLVLLGTKGGVGTSALAQAAAWTAAEKLGQKTLLLDMAGGWSSLGVGMGFDPTTTLSEAARVSNRGSAEDLQRMFHAASPKLSVLASGGDVMLERAIAHGQMESILDMVLPQFPLVILDTSGAPESVRQKAVVRANGLFLVSTPALSALRLSRTLIQEIRSLRADADKVLRLVINMAGTNPASEVREGDIKEALEVEPSAVIPFLPKLFMGCESEGQKILDIREGEALAMSKIAPLMRSTVLQGMLEGSADKDKDKADAGGGFLANLFKKK